jgi:hypothetical protein
MAHDPADFGAGDYDVEDLGDGYQGVIEYTAEDGKTYLLGDPDQVREIERQQMAQEVTSHELDGVRQELAQTYPDMPPALLSMLSAPDADGLRSLADEVARRQGYGRSDVADHPGHVPSRSAAASLPGANALERARSLARQGNPTPYLSLRDAAAYAESGHALTEKQAERVRFAAQWSRSAGDEATANYLMTQLARQGGSR